MITHERAATLPALYHAHRAIRGLANYYPGFDTWYWSKVAPAVTLGTGVCWLAQDAGQVIGVAIGRGGAEPKLQCVRVVPAYVGRGVGVHLIDRVLRDIACDQPVVTVPEEHLHELARVFVHRFAFVLHRVERGLYRAGKLEYVFNTHVDQRVRTPY